MSRTRELRALLALARALLTSRSARIRFRDTDRSTVERVVDVLALAFEPPRWIVATWSADRGSLRVLDLARILRVRPTRRRAGAAPEGFDPVYFAMRRLLDPDAGPPRPATIRVEPPWSTVAEGARPLVRRGTGARWLRAPPRPHHASRDRGRARGVALDRRCATLRATPMAKPRTEKKPHEARLLRLAAWILSQSEPVTRAQLFAALPDDYGGRPDTRRAEVHAGQGRAEAARVPPRDGGARGARRAGGLFHRRALVAPAARSTSARTRPPWSGPRGSRRSGSRSTRSATSWRARCASSSWAREASRRARPRRRSWGPTGAPTKARSSRSWSRRGSGAAGSACRTFACRRERS